MKKIMKNTGKLAGTIFLMMVLLCLWQQPAYAKTGNTTGNVIPGGSCNNGCRDGKYIYYGYFGKLYRFNTSNKKTTLVKKLNGIRISSVNVYKGKLYLAVEDMVSNGYDSYIYSMKTNGKGVKKLASGKCCMVDNGTIYYLQMKNCKVTAVGKMKLNGKGKKKLKNISGASYVNSLFVSGDRIYCDVFGTSYSSIYSMKKNGSDYKQEVGNCYALGCENGYLYFEQINYSTSTRTIWRKQLSTQKTEMVLTNVCYAAVSGNYVYYTVKQTDRAGAKATIYKKNLKTGKVSKITAGNGYSNIRVYGSWLYLIKDTYGTDKKGNEYNVQGIFMTTKGKKKKGLEKVLITNG